MSAEFDPDNILNPFILPKRIEKNVGDAREMEYTGPKYLAIPIMGDRIAIKIDGRPIIEYDSGSNDVHNCTDIDESSIYVTNRIECRYSLLGEHNYSC